MKKLLKGLVFKSVLRMAQFGSKNGLPRTTIAKVLKRLPYAHVTKIQTNVFLP